MAVDGREGDVKGRMWMEPSRSEGGWGSLELELIDWAACFRRRRRRWYVAGGIVCGAGIWRRVVVVVVAGVDFAE